MTYCKAHEECEKEEKELVERTTKCKALDTKETCELPANAEECSFEKEKCVAKSQKEMDKVEEAAKTAAAAAAKTAAAPK